MLLMDLLFGMRVSRDIRWLGVVFPLSLDGISPYEYIVQLSCLLSCVSWKYLQLFGLVVFEEGEIKYEVWYPLWGG